MTKDSKTIAELSDAALSALMVKDSQRLKRLLLSISPDQETTDSQQRELHALESRLEAAVDELDARHS